MRYHHFGDGRFALRLDAGEEVIASLRAFATSEQVEAGSLTGIGSLDHLTLGFLDPETNEYVRRRFEERLEVGSLTGTISREGDRPFIHLHAVVSPRELLAYTGHVHEAKVGAVLEIFVTAYPGRLERRTVSGQAFPALRLPGETEPEGSPPAR